MVTIIQLAGGAFALVMIYITYFSFKRKDFKIADLLLWSAVWILLLIGVFVPQLLDNFLEKIGVVGAITLFTIVAILFLFAVVFFLYRKVRKNTEQVERLVREIALKK